MRVASLHIYPVKGMRAVDLKEAAVENRGLSHDRRWMIVDAGGKFVTQRECAALATITAQVTPAGLTLSCGEKSIDIAYPSGTERFPVKVWKSEVPASVASLEANAWLAAILGIDCKLVWQGDVARAVSADWSQPGDEVSFADGFPLLIANAASLDDLNKRMPSPLPMNRFRPNIVIEGAQAWAEDCWKKLRIGEIEIDIVKPCTRCIVTTTDQQAGTRAGNEPLGTLKTFRLLRQPGITGVIFGQNAIARRLGTAQAGDSISVLETQALPAFEKPA